MKKLLIILLAILVAGLAIFTACGQSLTENDIATIRGLITRVDSLEAANSNLQGKVATLSTGASQADIEQMKSDLAAIKADLATLKTGNDESSTKVTALESRIKALEDKLATTTPSAPATGQVTVEILDQTPLLVYSTDAGMQYTFRVRIANGTSDYKYVAYSLNLICITAPAEVATGTTLTTFGSTGVTYTVIYIPDALTATQILFAPGSKIPVAKGGVAELQHLLTIKTTNNEQWEGNLTGVVVSSTW